MCDIKVVYALPESLQKTNWRGRETLKAESQEGARTSAMTKMKEDLKLVQQRGYAEWEGRTVQRSCGRRKEKTREEGVEVWVRNSFTQGWRSDSVLNRHTECQVPTEGCGYAIWFNFV